MFRADPGLDTRQHERPVNRRRQRIRRRKAGSQGDTAAFRAHLRSDSIETESGPEVVEVKECEGYARPRAKLCRQLKQGWNLGKRNGGSPSWTRFEPLRPARRRRSERPSSRLIHLRVPEHPGGLLRYSGALHIGRAERRDGWFRIPTAFRKRLLPDSVPCYSVRSSQADGALRRMGFAGLSVWPSLAETNTGVRLVDVHFILKKRAQWRNRFRHYHSRWPS